MKKYKFGFDFWGLILFLIIMIPNFIWFAIPAPHDILRAESVTPVVDSIASIAQVIMIICLCIFQKTGIEKIRITKLLIVTIVSCLLYFVCWILYYSGITNDGIILGLTIFPCLAFLCYSVDRKNMTAFVPAVIFTICHLIYALVNYII